MKLERASGLQRKPAREQLAAAGADARDVLVSERARRVNGKILGGYKRPAATLRIEHSHDALDFHRFRRQGPTRTLAGGVVDLPTFCNEPEKSAPIAERRLHGEVCQIMKSEMRGMTGLLLPCHRAVSSGATKDNAAMGAAIGAFGDLDGQHNGQTRQQYKIAHMSADNVWEAYAIRYAHHERLARENFLGALPADIHDGPMPLDYFVWAVKSATGRNFVIDTGFDEAMARKRQREFLHSPGEGLQAIGIEPDQVEDVILSHMHYDHCGNHAMFPNARYHVQDREMMFSTGRSMCHAHMRFPFDAEDVIAMVRRLFDGKLVFHDGDEEIAPGLSLHHVGGHSMGLQMVRVNTRRGWVVLATDAAHLYANMERDTPYPIVYNVAEVL